MERLRQVFGDGFEEGFPHIRTDEADGGENLGAHCAEELIQTALSSGSADPKEASGVGVNLVNEREEALGSFAFAPVEFIDANSGDALKISVSQTPLDHVFHRAAHALPTGTENDGRFLPRQPSRPTGQKLHKSQRHLAFAASPRHPFGRDAMNQTIHSTRSVDQQHGNHPQRHEFKTTGHGGSIIARSGFTTFSTMRDALAMRSNGHLDLKTRLAVAESHIFVNETLERVNAIEYRFDGQAHGWLGFGSPCREGGILTSRLTTSIPFSKDHFCPPPPQGKKWSTSNFRLQARVVSASGVTARIAGWRDTCGRLGCPSYPQIRKRTQIVPLFVQ